MLRVAIPNKGQLAQPAAQLLKEAGYLASLNARSLTLIDSTNNVEFFFLRPKDVAIYVGAGTIDLGITGRDMLLDSGAPALEIMQLGFAPSTFRLAVPKGSMSSREELNGKRIATSYEGLLLAWLERFQISAQIVRLDGAVENAVALGVADAVADVVATGATLRAAGLEVLGDPILESEAIVIRPENSEKTQAQDTFERRLHSVNVARSYVLVDFDVPNERLSQACEITPGIESPTISALQDPAWSAVRAMVLSIDVHRIMDELFALGAKGILVTDIQACRL
ncbi:MAG: ATP phosphoribosyltransferase [Candidatus Nanopelagicales bacterium]|jgi:ATP phosphoribosyltransferase